MLDPSSLPPGQHRAMEALMGGGESARTYSEAAQIAGVSEGTTLTHVNRVRQNHPGVYALIRDVRKVQLAVRHEFAVMNARAHSGMYFRNQNRMMRRLLGYNPGSF